jgi:hypothetical protein
VGPCTVVDGPWGVALNSPNLYVSNFGTDQVLIFNVHTGEYKGALGNSEILDSPEVRFLLLALLWLSPVFQASCEFKFDVGWTKNHVSLERG